MVEYVGKRFVVVGGGGGTSTVCTGLKGQGMYPTAIVTTADEGGSTGRIRNYHRIPAVGDARKVLCSLAEEQNKLARIFEYRLIGEGYLRDQTVEKLLLRALSDMQGPDRDYTGKLGQLFDQNILGESLARRLRKYGFRENDPVEGHALGNLILTALIEITGGYGPGLEKASRMLDIRGKVLPVTINDVTLIAELDTGERVDGEHRIDVPRHEPRRPIKRITLFRQDSQRPAELYYQAEDALIEADTIVMGPGDLWTSVLPNTIVNGFPEAVAEARKRGAIVVYVCNLVTKHGETNGLTTSGHLERVRNHIGPVDFVVCNTNTDVSPELLAAYAREQKYPVTVDTDGLERLGSKPITGDFISGTESRSRLLRHDPGKLARKLIGLSE